MNNLLERRKVVGKRDVDPAAVCGESSWVGFASLSVHFLLGIFPQKSLPPVYHVLPFIPPLTCLICPTRLGREDGNFRADGAICQTKCGGIV